MVTAPSPYDNTTPGYGPNDYLAMYLTIGSGMSPPHITVPVRHFGSTLARLGNALANLPILKSKALARAEAGKIEITREAAILLDSTLPGRKNIIRRNVQGQNIQDRLSRLVARIAARTPGDLTEFSLRCGMKNFSMPYPRDWVDPSTNFKPGSFIVQCNDVRGAEIIPFTVGNSLFIAVEFKPIIRTVVMDL